MYLCRDQDIERRDSCELVNAAGISNRDSAAQATIARADDGHWRTPLTRSDAGAERRLSAKTGNSTCKNAFQKAVIRAMMEQPGGKFEPMCAQAFANAISN